MYSEAHVSLYSPETMPELLNHLKAHPTSTISAGHTWLSRHGFHALPGQEQDLVALRRIEELHRLYRSERVLEVGAMVPLQKMLYLDQTLLPRALRSALTSTVPYPARALATLGGNLCLPSPTASLFCLLSLWDARVELRRAGGARAIMVRELLDQDRQLSLEPGELLAKIKIPLGRWTHQYHERFEGDFSGPVPSLTISALARISGTSVDEFRLAYQLDRDRVLRSLDLESRLVGQRLPLHGRALDNVLEDLEKELSREENEAFVPLKPRVLGLAQKVLSTMHTMVEGTYEQWGTLGRI